MNSLIRSILGVIGVIGLSAPVLAAPPYAVIFEVTRSADGNVEQLQISKVIDPASGSTEAVNVAVPADYVENVRAKIQATAASPDKPHYFTYFLFDPRDPTNANIGGHN